jgi:hypothetical protein
LDKNTKLRFPGSSTLPTSVLRVLKKVVRGFLPLSVQKTLGIATGGSSFVAHSARRQNHFTSRPNSSPIMIASHLSEPVLRNFWA